MARTFPSREAVMRRAVELARRGLGRVEPNPPVGAVVVDEGRQLLGEGFHERFGGPHAEVNALEQAGERAAGATLFVTLEPCCHQGKTPPCTQAIRRAGIRRVEIAVRDPAPHADGQGAAELDKAGIEIGLGMLEEEAALLIAPFAKLIRTGLPWVHAKWAMTLDGKIASRTGHSQWISGTKSREVVHQLRGRMDAVVIGAATARRDDPLLTARPPGPRTALRVVVDGEATLPLDSQLIRTVAEAPVLVAACESAPETNVRRLQDTGAEILQLPAVQGRKEEERRPDLRALLRELGRREMTHVFVEGGGRLLGGFFDGELIDEVHVFVAPKLVGGETAVTPLTGKGLDEIPERPQLVEPDIEILDGDVYIHGPLARE